jgi:hypothetical protein
MKTVMSPWSPWSPRTLLPASLAMPLAAALLLAGCASTPNTAEVMAQQADAQIELAKLRDKEARAEYNDQSVYLGLINRMQTEAMYFASLAHIDAFQQKFGSNPSLLAMRADALRETGQDDAACRRTVICSGPIAPRGRITALALCSADRETSCVPPVNCARRCRWSR